MFVCVCVNKYRILLQVQGAVQFLFANGAHHVMVVGLPPLGATPLAGMLQAASALDSASLKFNCQLKKAIDILGKTLPANKMVYNVNMTRKYLWIEKERV